MNRCRAWRYSVASWFMDTVCTRCPAWCKASCNAFAKPHVLLPSLPTRMTVSADCGPLFSAMRGIERRRCHRIAYLAWGKLLLVGTVAEVVAGSGLTTWTVSGPDLAA